MKRVIVLAALMALLVSLSAVFVSAQDEISVEQGPITQRIIERGELICGGNQNLTGFGVVNDAGEFEGFDIDICRAPLCHNSKQQLRQQNLVYN
jgi:ABC-type amino acid transport substrate-binding protein